MSVIAKAKALKAEADKKKADEAEQAVAAATYKQKAYQQILEVVGKCLAELRGAGFQTKNSWNGGADVFTVSKHERAILSIVVRYVWHDRDGGYSSDAGSSLEIAVVPEEWRGPHDTRGTCGLSDDTFQLYVANLIKDHL